MWQVVIQQPPLPPRTIMTHTPGKFGSHKKQSGPSTLKLPQEPKFRAFFDIETFVPMHDLVLLKVFTEDEPLIHLPETAQTLERRATVIRVGPGRETDWGHVIKPPFSEGQSVYLAPGGGFPLEIEKKTSAYMIARPNEILGYFNEPQSTETAESTAVLPDHSGEGDLGPSVLETAPQAGENGTDQEVAG